MREATGDLARLRRFTSFHARRIVSTSLSLASWGLIMLFAALRSHRQLHASRVAACALFFVAVANVSSTRAAEHTLTPSPQTVHIGYFLASINLISIPVTNTSVTRRPSAAGGAPATIRTTPRRISSAASSGSSDTRSRWCDPRSTRVHAVAPQRRQSMDASPQRSSSKSPRDR
jgi:hypothetical protein